LYIAARHAAVEVTFMNISLRRIARRLSLLSRVCTAACIFAAVLAPRAAAQGVSYNDIARTADNTPLSNGMVAVCSANPTNPGNVGQPCAPLATIYTDATLATPAQNPINADIHGNFSFWGAPGVYFLEFYSPLRATPPFTETVTLGCVPNSTAAGCGSGITRSVQAYGALCDDTTDDTAAIQAAVNSLPTSGNVIGGIISFSGVCKTTASINVNTANVTFEGLGHFQFITQDPPPSYIDFQGTTPQNAINVNAQGFAMDNLGVKYPTTIGGPLAPPAAPAMTQVAGSGCPAEAYYAEATYTSSQGQTVDSPEATFTTTTGNCLAVESPSAETGATGWNVFVSTNSNNETKQTSSPIAIGTNWTFTGTLVNLGFRPAVDTTAYSAIYDPNGAQLEGVKLFTNLASSAGTASTANGYTSFGCCGKLQNVYIAGFGYGILGSGANNDFSIIDSYVQADYWGAFIANGADVNVERTDFEGNVVGNLKMLYGSPYKISGNYFEQQGSNPPSYNVQVGDTTIPPQGFTPTPGAITIDNNFMQCNLTVYPPSPIVVETSQVLDIERNSFSQCEHEDIVDDEASASTAHITMLGNISDAQPLAWITHTTGVVESDVDAIGTAENPGTPYFYGLGIDSQSGPSAIAFNSAGASAWNLQAAPATFSFIGSGNNTLQVTPFGSQTKPSVLSNYAMDAAEVIVTQSGGTATFDAGLGNMFELIMSANVTSSTLINAQPGQWLDFIICQGGGGPWTFAWPSNVFGGGTVGTTNGPCSTQQFYVSGSNAWAAGPMTINVTSGSPGLSLPAVAGTVPYFTGSWTNGDCLQAGGSSGLVTLASGPCGSGGSASWTSLTGGVNTNGGFIVAPSSTSTVGMTLLIPSSGTADALDICSNSGSNTCGTKYWWIDSTGAMNFGGLNLTLGTPGTSGPALFTVSGQPSGTSAAGGCLNLLNNGTSVTSYLCEGEASSQMMLAGAMPSGDTVQDYLLTPSTVTPKSASYTASCELDFNRDLDFTTGGFTLTIPSAGQGASDIDVNDCGSGWRVRVSNTSSSSITVTSGAVSGHQGQFYGSGLTAGTSFTLGGNTNALIEADTTADTNGNFGYKVTLIGGNAATATALAATPTQCGSNQIATGIAANGNANCTSFGGGAETYTASQTLASSDSGHLVIMNCSGCTVTLPVSPPSSFWNVAIESPEGASVTISPNGLTFNGSSSSFTLNPLETLFITTDGSNYYGNYQLPGPFSAGTCTLSSGSCSHTFTQAYPAAPICTATDTTSAAAVKVATSTTAVTLTGTGSDVVAFTCMAANN
jgi:hypothetical protein